MSISPMCSESYNPLTEFQNIIIPNHSSNEFPVSMILIIGLHVYFTMVYLAYVGYTMESTLKLFRYHSYILNSNKRNLILSFDEAMELCYDDDRKLSLRGLLYLNDVIERETLTQDMRDKIMDVFLDKMMDTKQIGISVVLQGLYHIVQKNKMDISEIDYIVGLMIQRANSNSIDIKINGLACLVGFAKYNLLQSSRIRKVTELMISKATTDGGDISVEYISIFGLTVLLENKLIPTNILERVLSVLIFKCVNSFFTVQINAIRGIHTMIMNSIIDSPRGTERVIDLVITKCSDPCNGVRSDAVRILHDLLQLNLIPTSKMEMIVSIMLARCNDCYTTVRYHALNVIAKLSTSRLIPISKLNSSLHMLTIKAQQPSMEGSILSIVTSIRDILSYDSLLLPIEGLDNHVIDRKVIIDRNVIDSLFKYLSVTVNSSHHVIRYHAISSIRFLVHKNLIQHRIGDMPHISALMIEKSYERNDKSVDQIINLVAKVSYQYFLPLDVERSILTMIGIEDSYDKSITESIYCLSDMLLKNYTPITDLGSISKLLHFKCKDRSESVRIAAYYCKHTLENIDITQCAVYE